MFGRVRVSHLHPGIHVEHYRGPNGLEHDYIVDPGADPGRIRFTIEGGDRTGLAANGDLLVHAGDDVVRFHKPTIYQQAGPDRDLVEARAMIGHEGECSLLDGDRIGVGEIMIAGRRRRTGAERDGSAQHRTGRESAQRSPSATDAGTRNSIQSFHHRHSII